MITVRNGSRGLTLELEGGEVVKATEIIDATRVALRVAESAILFVVTAGGRRRLEANERIEDGATLVFDMPEQSKARA